MADWRPFWILLTSAKLVIGYPCVRHYILFYFYGPTFSHFFELSKYHKIFQVQNGH